jgi:hypothetical protein
MVGVLSGFIVDCEFRYTSRRGWHKFYISLVSSIKVAVYAYHSVVIK